jgi:hypothetical protein
MGFFSLKKKKKGVEKDRNHEACGEQKATNLSEPESSQSQEQDQQHSFPSITVDKKPVLEINTTPLTPPLTPNTSPHHTKSSSSPSEQQDHTQRKVPTPRVHFNPDPRYPSRTPPESPGIP